MNLRHLKDVQSGLGYARRSVRAGLWKMGIYNKRSLIKKESDVLYAFYDLSIAPVTFDIVKFLLLAELRRKKLSCNSLHVVIVPGPDDGFCPNEVDDYHRSGAVEYDTESLRWRLRNILVPCSWLIPSCRQITVSTSRREAEAFQTLLVKHVFPAGYTVRFPEVNYDYRNILEAVPKNAIPPSIEATPQGRRFVNDWIRQRSGGRKVITVTLRENSWHQDRNSNFKDWGMFAHGLDPNIYHPVLIRDTEAAFKPLPSTMDGLTVFREASWNIELRIALYELSYLNMFTNSGPATLCRLNRRARSITFKLVTPFSFTGEFFRSRWGVPPGSQSKLQTPFQQLVWEDDKLEVIQEAFKRMCERIEK